MINQIGIMRAIGISNKKIKKMFRISSCIYILLGTIIGMVIGSIFSYFGGFIVYGRSSRLVIEPLSIILSFAVSIIAVSISNFIAVKRAMKMSIIDSIRNSDKYKRKAKNKYKKSNINNQNVMIKFANRNIWRNKPRTILTIIAMSMVGAMFIFNYVAMNLLKSNPVILGGVNARSFGNVDITLSGDIANNESLFYKIDGDIINKIKNEDNVKKLNLIFITMEDIYLLKRIKQLMII